jgi:ABC-type dipeptide/oligopeptide/nickel transport system permease subunit
VVRFLDSWQRCVGSMHASAFLANLVDKYKLPPKILEAAQASAEAFVKSGGAVLGLCLVVAMALAALVAPALAPHDPDAIDTARRLARPFTTGHRLGTDEF